ncbi:hypothetical protein G7025_10305 [Pseudomonas lurida]|uniref:hypothetical protein n=1 Tax=Pseudomonas lurida TaxID=244566 RepID=UPI0015E305B9|nr:hypothetical protein [Pseudomonas lurida]MBA1293750.1 hypothetical protein [Pseudomonas lurida]
MNNTLIRRQVVITDLTDTNIEIINPQFAVLMFPNPTDKGMRYLDIGSFCYMRRSTESPYKVIRPVDLSTLDNSRLRFIQGLIEHLRQKRNTSALDDFSKIKLYLDWIDAQNENYHFDDTQAMKKAYSDYTRHLLHRMNSTRVNGQPIKKSSASVLQARARTVLMLATGLSEPEAKAISSYIPKKDVQVSHPNLKLPSIDIQARTFASLVNFIYEAHRILVEGGKFPLHLVSPDGDSYYLYSMIGESEKSKTARISLARMLVQHSTFPSWSQVKENFMLADNSAATRIERANYDDNRRRFRNNNEDMRSSLRRQIGTCAGVAGMLAFIAATGSNLSIAQRLEVDTLEILPSTQGNRFSGTKARANGKIVYPEFGARFAPVFKKYLELRRWILNGVENSLVFPVDGAKSSGVSRIGATSINSLKKLMASALPNTTWVTPTQWRKNVSYQYVKHSGGDMALTAEKLSNTEQTVRQNYSRPALDDFAAEMTEFFDSMHQAAINRTRSVEHISVRISDEKSLNTVTGTGLCEKGPLVEPKRAVGFTERSPMPACGDPETCLFCEFYAVHADEEDIRRLLSLRYIIQATKAQLSVEHWEIKFGPTSHRIDEVLSVIQDTDEKIDKTIRQVREEVELGALDPFWSIHFDTLVTVGEVS